MQWEEQVEERCKDKTKSKQDRHGMMLSTSQFEVQTNPKRMKRIT